MHYVNYAEAAPRVRWFALGLFVLLAAAAACSSSREAPAPDAARAGQAATNPAAVSAAIAGSAAPDSRARPLEFVSESFEELYPIFLIRRSMPQGEKARLWTTRYLGRWVRWTGLIRSVTPNGVTLKHLPSTITFDVSLWLEADQMPLLRRKYHKGDSLSYVARLDSYDDIFRTLYLGHGSIVEAQPTDGGAP